MLESEIKSAPVLGDSIILARWILDHIDMTPDELAQVLDLLGDVQRSMQANEEIPQWARDAA